MYDLHLQLHIPNDPNYMPVRLINKINTENTRDWPSQILEMIPVKGTLDYRRVLGACGGTGADRRPS